jgi:hypothetical protein
MFVRYVRYAPVRIGYVSLPFNSASASASASASTGTAGRSAVDLLRPRTLQYLVLYQPVPVLYHSIEQNLLTLHITLWPFPLMKYKHRAQKTCRDSTKLFMGEIEAAGTSSSTLWSPSPTETDNCLHPPRLSMPSELDPLTLPPRLGAYSLRSRPKGLREAEWSRAYRTVCLVVALLVSTCPLILAGLYVSLLPSDAESSTARGDMAAGLSNIRVGSGHACRSSIGAINGSLHLGGPNGTGRLVATALLLDEGPRGEYRRRAREAVAAARARALGASMSLFAFDRCAIPPGSAALLAGESAAAACRLAHAVTRHKCNTLRLASQAVTVTKQASAHDLRGLEVSTTATAAPPCAAAAPRLAPKASSPLQVMCALDDAGEQAGGAASSALSEAVLRLDGCCSTRMRAPRSAGTGNRGRGARTT